MYWSYLKYVLVHKWYVFLECLKTGQIIHGITHDMSKFLPSEFIPYAKWFYGDYGIKNKCPAKWAGYTDDIFHVTKYNFDRAWCYHQHRNKHHWDYWVKSDGEPVPMPFTYISQMVIDWRAMGRVFNGTAEEYYKKHKARMKLHPDTISGIEEILSFP